MTIGDPGVTERDFFVSYQQADRAWAEWIAWQLEDAGHSVLFQGWDFVPGTNWIKLMQDGVSHSARVIVVLSPAYIDSVFGAAEWQTIWAHDPTGAKRRVIPVRVADCERPGLLAGIVGIDLFDVPQPKALQRLQDAINRALAGQGETAEAALVPGSGSRRHRHGHGALRRHREHIRAAHGCISPRCRTSPVPGPQVPRRRSRRPRCTDR